MENIFEKNEIKFEEWAFLLNIFPLKIAKFLIFFLKQKTYVFKWKRNKISIPVRRKPLKRPRP